MAKAKPLSDDELGALVDKEIRQSVGYFGGKLADQRRKAEYYYLGLPKEELAPPAIADRSSVVVPVVRNTIEAMLPQLIVKFTGGDTVVEFEPTKPGDEDAAKNCTDYLNYLFFKKNNGHHITYSWFKDALKLKRGILKVWWDTRDEETREEYKGLSEVELSQLMDDKEVEVTEQKSYPSEEDQEHRDEAMKQLQAQMQQPPQPQQPGQPDPRQQIQAQMQQIQSAPPVLLYDVVCKRTKSGGKVCIENVPPEEFLISRKAKDIANAPFVGHRVRRTMSELRSMGYKNVDDLGNDDNRMNAEALERDGYDDEYADLNDDTGDESQRRVWVIEGYIRCDYDGDGIAELRKVCRAGGVTLENEIVDVAPFVSICPIPEPHKFFGLSVADLCMVGQRVETTILRGTIDNQNLEVNGRYGAVEGQVNLDDLLSSRPGGVVRVKSPGAVFRLDQGKGDLSMALNMLEYMKGFNEDSSGWSRQSQGNDAAGLKNETATAKNIVTNKADMRTDLIARNFAEGFVELFRLMLKLVCQHQNEAAQVKLSGAWVDMDPRQWRNQFDVTINVGMGVGNKDQQVAHLSNLLQVQAGGMQMGTATPENVYNASVELAKNMGFKNGDKFFTKPDPNKPPVDPNAGQMQIEQMKVQAKAQSEMQALQAKMQSEQQHMQQEAQLEQMRAQYQAMVDQNRQKSEEAQQRAKIQLEAELSQLKEHYAAQDRQRDMEFQQWKVSMELQSRERIAQINAESKLDAAQVAANATLSAAQEGASDQAVSGE